MSPGKSTGEKKNRKRQSQRRSPPRRSQWSKCFHGKIIALSSTQSQEFEIESPACGPSLFVFNFEASTPWSNIQEKFEKWPAGGILAFLTKDFSQKQMGCDLGEDDRSVVSELKPEPTNHAFKDEAIKDQKSEQCILQEVVDTETKPKEMLKQSEASNAESALPPNERVTTDTTEEDTNTPIRDPTLEHTSSNLPTTATDLIQEDSRPEITPPSLVHLSSIPSSTGLGLTDLPAEIICMILEYLFYFYADQKHYMNLGYAISIISHVHSPWTPIIDRLLHAMDLRYEPGNKRWKTMLVQRKRQLKQIKEKSPAIGPNNADSSLIETSAPKTQHNETSTG